MAHNQGQLVVEDAKIIYKHFAGLADDFHREGERDFSLRLDNEDVAMKMADDGWNVKEKTLEDGTKYWHVKVKISYKFQAPKVYIVKKDKSIPLDESTIGTLDHAEIIRADVVVDPSVWSVRGETGVTGYLRSLYVRIQEDPFAERYSNGYGALENNDADADNPF